MNYIELENNCKKNNKIKLEEIFKKIGQNIIILLKNISPLLSNFI